MTDQMWSRPEYFEYHKLPAKVIPGADGQPVVWRFTAATGGWRRDDEALVEIESNSRLGTSRLDRVRFIELTEWARARYGVGDGPLRALYETLSAVGDQAGEERRPLTANERALIGTLSRKTYAMFERDLAARGEPGADPSPES